MIRSDDDRPATSRRDALKLLSSGFGWLAFRGLAAGGAASAIATPAFGAPRFQDATFDPLAPKAPHFPARAKRVIYLCMSGAPSHVDTFDYKPKLGAADGQSFSGAGRVRAGAKLMASPWKFSPHGRSGLQVSELLPRIGALADDLCLLHGMQTDVPAHAQAFLKMHTGSFQFVRPSVGAWTLYGLGTSNRNVPGFVTLNAPTAAGGAQNYGSAFLPAYFQGQRIGVQGRARGGRGGAGGEALEDIANAKLSTEQQRRQLDLTQKLNRESRSHAGDQAVEGVIQSYELAFRMQAEVPGLLDLDKESKETRDLYGVGGEGTDAFGRQCLTARRLIEAGVRFVEVNHGSWDHHQQLRERLTESCTAIDKPVAGLLTDLKRRGLLKDTLVLWGGEFGRTPYAQNGDGRDHNHRGFTMWMAGGGVKGGFAYGATDDVGSEAVAGKMSTYDLHATVLHLLGLDHERLTFNYAGRDFRLTDVHGVVAKDILA